MTAIFIPPMTDPERAKRHAQWCQDGKVGTVPLLGQGLWMELPQEWARYLGLCAVWQLTQGATRVLTCEVDPLPAGPWSLADLLR